MIRPTDETVLLYQIPDKKQEFAIKRILVSMGIRIRNVEKEEWNTTVGELLGVRKMKQAAGNKVEEESQTKTVLHETNEKKAVTNSSANQIDADSFEESVMVMQLHPGRMDVLIQEMKRLGVANVTLKAIVTEYNVDWTFGQLANELMQEHRKLTGAK